MGNLHDYVLWRGDLSFEQSPLNEVDDLLLSQLAYVSFGPFVPGVKMYPHFVTLRAAAQRLLEYDPDGGRIHQHAFMWKNNKRLLELCAQSRRFGEMRLTAYADELSAESQFAALCMEAQKGLYVIAFRGTDDSIAGWKEDLLMALSDPIPAQKRAAEYLAHLAPQLNGKIILTGHSKGGNLAVFAAAGAPDDVQENILRICNLDGPGFSKGLIESMGYEKIRTKLSVMLPESSIVGRLLEHEQQYHIIDSRALGIFQHDAYSWQVQGKELLRSSRMTPYSEYMSAVVRGWLEELDESQRREFLETVFDTFSGMEARVIGDAPAAFFAALPQIVRKMSTLDREHKDALLRLVRELGGASLKTLRDSIRQKEKELRGEDDPPSID